jgi:hypothetical protein
MKNRLKLIFRYGASHSRVAPENVGLQNEQKYNTFACHTCMKCCCHRRCWKCPPWASIHNWTRRCMFLKVSARITSHLSSRLTETWAESRLRNRLFSSLLSYLIFSCFRLPFCEFPKHTTAFHYRYDMQMYCTFVLFVNQHFPGLPARITFRRSCMLKTAAAKKLWCRNSGVKWNTVWEPLN